MTVVVKLGSTLVVDANGRVRRSLLARARRGGRRACARRRAGLHRLVRRDRSRTATPRPDTPAAGHVEAPGCFGGGPVATAGGMGRRAARGGPRGRADPALGARSRGARELRQRSQRLRDAAEARRRSRRQRERRDCDGRDHVRRQRRARRAGRGPDARAAADPADRGRRRLRDPPGCSGRGAGGRWRRRGRRGARQGKHARAWGNGQQDRGSAARSGCGHSIGDRFRATAATFWA